MPRGLYIELPMLADSGAMDRLWDLTQTPALHSRWDLRFTEITNLPPSAADEPQRFRYVTRIGFGVEIAGLGESTAARETADGVRVSSLRFWSGHRLSLIREGSGYWRYVPALAGSNASHLRFLTWYDYQTRFGLLGRTLDIVFRPLIGWATAWSFDRLRFWVEEDIPPEVVRTCSLIYTAARLTVVFVWLWHGLVPKLLFRDADELAMLHDASLGSAALPWIGGAEVAMALFGLIFWRRRAYLAVTALAMVAALAGVGWRSPRYFKAAFNPVTLNIGVFVLAMTSWWAWRYTAFAGRCLRRAPRSASGGTV